jgi:hypothetical protein
MIFAATKQIFAVNQKVKEVNNDRLLDIILDTCCSKEANQGLEILFCYMNHVQLPTVDKVFLEPGVLVVKETCQEHGVLGNKLLAFKLVFLIGPIK